MQQDHPYPLGSRVIIRPLWEEGVVENIHFDDHGFPIFTITRDEDGKPHLCRDFELAPTP